MHSSGSMTRIRSGSWMQSTGQTSTQERSLMSMQGSAMMYVTALLYRGQQLSDQRRCALDESRPGDDLVESGGVRGLQSTRVGVVREADDGDVGIRVRDLVRIDPRDVRDHELGRLDGVRGHEMVLGQQGLELATEEEIDPRQQDRRHER